MMQYESEGQAQKRLTLFRRHSAVNFSNTDDIVKGELYKGVTETYANANME